MGNIPAKRFMYVLGARLNSQNPPAQNRLQRADAGQTARRGFLEWIGDVEYIGLIILPVLPWLAFMFLRWLSKRYGWFE